MSWITKKGIVSAPEKEGGLTTKEIGERIPDNMTKSALSRVWKNGAHVYYLAGGSSE